MPGFFEAFAKLPPAKPKVHTVTVQGQSLVVTLEKKLEVIANGEDAYMWKSPTEIMLKPRPKTKRKFPVLKKEKLGFKFRDGDPFWVESVTEGGHAWQTESE